ncbi:response regulator transcription factor [Dactylosporangium sp. NPDC049140]|uniref:response regulator transcription factor n=1 Tax=Dactylosporangium sp. NPDC049140 TaxID=3155647 RepID=UPI0033E246FD
MAQVLLVEDDAEIRRALIHALSQLGHAVMTAGDGMRGLQMALDAAPDLVVLDLGLPDMDGRDVLRMLRSVSQVPIIVATARDQETAIVEALDRGADDYLSKPFGAVQLDARIRAVLRRTAGGRAGANAPLVAGGLRIDLAAREVVLDDAPVELSAREFDLLSYLAARAGTVVSKRELINEVWHQPYSGTDKTVDVHLSWLRRKLGESAREPRYLHTVRGIGVKFVPYADPSSR